MRLDDLKEGVTYEMLDDMTSRCGSTWLIVKIVSREQTRVVLEELELIGPDSGRAAVVSFNVRQPGEELGITRLALAG